MKIKGKRKIGIDLKMEIKGKRKIGEEAAVVLFSQKK
jgi:hypothetical protein